MSFVIRLCLSLFVPIFLVSFVQAEVKSLEIYERKDFANGQSFGKVGPYKLIRGVAHFAVNPDSPHNKLIVDLDKAPRNKDGLVEWQSDIFILAPKNPAKGNGAILYDVNNRGRKLALRFFNDAPGNNNPHTKKDAGNGFLFRQGYTVVWCGWIGELLPGDDRLLMKPPVATDNGKPIRGVVKYEMVTDKEVQSMPLSRRDGHGSYPPTKRGETTGKLTWRTDPYGKRVPIPNEQWRLEFRKQETVKRGVSGSLGQVQLRIAGGFRPGYIYELVCEAEGPIVQGLGFASTRDLISYLRYDTGKGNPISDSQPRIQYAYGFGVSQSGRFLRHLVYEAFNVDEKDRIVFDGLIPHVAGAGLGFFNHRFAQPTRHNGQLEDHFYPADVFPFTYGISTDPFRKHSDGILKRLQTKYPDCVPKIMHTQSAAEYWHRAGSLPHTDPLGKKDAEIPENVRIYAFGGTQHGPASWPPTKTDTDNLHNPGDYRPLLRALLVALDDWVRTGKAPPASVYPKIADKTLVHWDQQSTGFPHLPGVRYPEFIQQPPLADFGERFRSEKIITREPPKIVGRYTVLVPRSDKDGNDVGTLLIPDVAVQLATYTGWNLRHRSVGAEGQLSSLRGSYIPFARTKIERMRTGDPRLSLEERYVGYEDYVGRLNRYARTLVKGGYLLIEDADRFVDKRKQLADIFRTKN